MWMQLTKKSCGWATGLPPLGGVTFSYNILNRNVTGWVYCRETSVSYCRIILQKADVSLMLRHSVVAGCAGQ